MAHSKEAQTLTSTTEHASESSPARSSGQALALVRFEGSDALTFLQGYLTCDLTALTPDKALPAALLSLKGRVTCNGWALLLGNTENGTGPETRSDVGLLCHESVADGLLEGLARYLAFSKTRATRASQPPIVSAEPATVSLGDELWLDLGGASDGELTGTELWARLTAAQRVLVQAETTDQFLPQMLGLDAWGAIDFDKGCYLGQEVVARAQHRGAVKRQLVFLSRTQAAARSANIPAGTALLQEDRLVGTLVQSSNQGVLAVVKTGLTPSSVLKAAPAEDAAGTSDADTVIEFLLP